MRHDQRHLNAITTKDSYLLPRIDDALDSISSSAWFSAWRGSPLTVSPTQNGLHHRQRTVGVQRYAIRIVQQTSHIQVAD
ncbi:hypothetical protein AAFF_G00407070 [Aldrovandia affinis]|uniref:Uncharacterized protein n=1 Tax=Aldrovandia affinis TaxID=143900 RepID=A0AAD7SCB4_9TELE|nr:hypothetical protein AAFF_G00407070 [Aldrovandia affinis]